MLAHGFPDCFSVLNAYETSSKFYKDNGVVIDRLLLAAQKILLFYRIRIAVGLVRYFFYKNIYGIKTWEDKDGEHLGRDTFQYNLDKIYNSVVKHERVLHIIWPLLAIERVAKYRTEFKTLSIGPRSEGELLLIAAHGFRWRNIRGVDLFSYSPSIDVADMHELPYPDNSFDVVFSGWVLTYSNDQPRALKEMVRVLKPGGYISFGNGYDSSLGTDADSVGADQRANTIEEMFSPIKANIDRFYFRHDIDAEQAARGERALIAVLSVRK